MPHNLDALLRYHVIDQCLQSNHYGCTLEHLAEKCTEALIENGGNPQRSTVSKRTIQYDIKKMRGDSLGYNAPIETRNGKYVYSDKNFRIANATISKTDVENIAIALNSLKPYKGALFFGEIKSLIERLEHKVLLNTFREAQAVVAFEHMPESAGSEWIIPLTETIINKQVIRVTYQRFGAGEPKNHLFHPYLLKEYRNRWYVLGMNGRHKEIQTFALDRIKKVEGVPGEEYNEEHRPDCETYFKYTVGITLPPKAEPEEIILRFNHLKLHYIKTQPVHETQEILDESPSYITVKLQLILNYELESLIMSFADEVEILKPEKLRKRIAERIRNAAGIPDVSYEPPLC